MSIRRTSCWTLRAPADGPGQRPGTQHGPDHVYLSDFGISKQQSLSSTLTSTGQLVGTLDYVAPEQIEGRLLDGRADQYSLACAAFELLSGMPPFRDRQGLALLYAQLSGQPPSLSASRGDLPSPADQVLARALSKDPAARPAASSPPISPWRSARAASCRRPTARC